MITEPVLASREDVKNSTDMQGTAYNNRQVDRALQAASRDAEGLLNRRIYPEDTVKYFDWPPQGGQGGSQISYPWRIWLDANDLITLTALESPPGTSLNVSYVNLEPANYGPPFTYMELQRDKPIAFSSGPTPQRSIKATGTWGYSASTESAGQLAASISSTSATTITVSDASLVDVGNLLLVDAERLLVQDRSTTSSGQTNVSGATTAVDNDVAVTVTDGTQIHAGEVILIDSERMLVLDITGNVLTVKRAYDGTSLATHSTSSTINVYRVLTVLRGQLGTTAATHTNSTTIARYRPPQLVKELVVAEAVNIVLQETSGWSRTVGSDASRMNAPGDALDDIRKRAVRKHGRKSRMRAV